jgi:uncharacterized phage protein (TIGR02220 family)
MKDPAFPFYANDFLSACQIMTHEERGQYITLLSFQWVHNGIPKKRVGFLVGCSWDDVSDLLRSKFVDDGETLKNQRLEDERAKRAAFKAKQSLNGSKGGRPSKSHKVENPIKSQKKPLENENEYEGEKEREIESVIEMLNDRAQKGFQPDAKTHRKHIRARMAEGATLRDFELVIEYKTAEWLGENDLWLRPSTLFNSDKFQIYLDEARNSQNKGVTPRQVYEARNGGSTYGAIAKATGLKIT